MILKKQAGLLPCLFRDFLSRRLSQNGDLAADYHTDNIDNPENCGSDENPYDTHNYFQYASACHARANTINAVNYPSSTGRAKISLSIQGSLSIAAQ